MRCWEVYKLNEKISGKYLFGASAIEDEVGTFLEVREPQNEMDFR